MRERGLPAVGPRDRRGGRPHLPVHRPQPPGVAAAPRLPAARPHQAPCHRGPLRPVVGRRRSSGGRPATSRSWATSPPAPTCWPRRTSRRYSRYPPTSPATATSSCCASGATPWSTPASSTATSSSPASRRAPSRARSWWPASPARRPRSRPSAAKAARSCCVPANSRLLADGVRPRRRPHLRAGRHRAAPLVASRKRVQHGRPPSRWPIPRRPRRAPGGALRSWRRGRAGCRSARSCRGARPRSGA